MSTLGKTFGTGMLVAALCAPVLGDDRASAPTDQPASSAVRTRPASSYAQFIGTLVGTCPLVLENELLKFKMGRVSATEAVAEVKRCAQAKAASSESSYETNVRPQAGVLPSECKGALFALRADALAHFEGFSADPLESPARQVRRVADEAARLRSLATRARLICE